MVEMKIYHCKNMEENPMPVWMHKKSQQETENETHTMDLVQQFKQNPDAFFPEFTNKIK